MLEVPPPRRLQIPIAVRGLSLPRDWRAVPHPVDCVVVLGVDQLPVAHRVVVEVLLRIQE